MKAREMWKGKKAAVPAQKTEKLGAHAGAGSRYSLKIRLMSFIMLLCGVVMLFVNLYPASAFVATAVSLFALFAGAIAIVHSTRSAKLALFAGICAIEYVVLAMAWSLLLAGLLVLFDLILIWALFLREKRGQ